MRFYSVTIKDCKNLTKISSHFVGRACALKCSRANTSEFGGKAEARSRDPIETWWVCTEKESNDWHPLKILLKPFCSFNYITHDIKNTFFFFFLFLSHGIQPYITSIKNCENKVSTRKVLFRVGPVGTVKFPNDE